MCLAEVEDVKRMVLVSRFDGDDLEELPKKPMRRFKSKPQRALTAALYSAPTLFVYPSVSLTTPHLVQEFAGAHELRERPMHPGSLAQVQLVDDQVSEESKVRDTAESEVLPSADELIPLTELQTLISEAIISNEGSAPFDYIYDSVSASRKKLKGKDGQPKNTDAKRAILASLSKNINSQPLFQRDPEHPGNWMLGKYNPMHAKHYSKTFKAANVSTPVSPPSGELTSEEVPKQELVLQPTELQLCILETIDSFPGAVADLDQISSAVLAKLQSNSAFQSLDVSIIAHELHTPALFVPISISKGLWGVSKAARQLLIELVKNAVNVPKDHTQVPKKSLPLTGYSLFVSKSLRRNNDENEVISFDERTTRSHAFANAASRVPIARSSIGMHHDENFTYKRPKREEEKILQLLLQQQQQQQQQLEDDMEDALEEWEDEKSAGDVDEAQVNEHTRNLLALQFDSKSNESDYAGDQPTHTVELTDLQKLIRNAIELHGGSASFDTIVAEVSKSYSNLRRRDGTPYHADCKRAIQASLSAHPYHPGRTFSKHPTLKDHWVIAIDSRSTAKDASSDSSSSPHSTTSNTATSKTEIRKSSNSVGTLTDMQKLLIRIILSNGGSCPFQTIIDEVSRVWSKLKRRDGSSYSSDSVRAVKASLSNNTYSTPIFKRDPKNADLWLVADRSYADAVIQEDSSLQFTLGKRKLAEISEEESADNQASTSDILSDDRRRSRRLIAAS